ncbi:MAG TPA: carboxymuconolactone decarboxylase family protein [Steroidobacteraceae bacterium]|jgi:AhpD family alkylhydroperoxidase|nr:carboxymuconolactone decarboxylase family protein [Steroidobacteraceae bacterium]
MNSRLDWFTAVPAAAQALLHVQAFVNKSGLEPKLLELVKLRASQINGCAYCIDMHTKDARAAGETEQRLYLLDAWHEAAHLYSERERAAIAWTEALTRLGEAHVPDDVYAQVRARFSDAELVTLTLAVTAINSWNRMNIAFRVQAGGYQPGMFKRAMGE